jgi:UDP:flavonoid glycosyltransferase YjiC (YdhE family)
LIPTPKRTLIAWELGGNLGHLLRIEPVARALRARGHQVTWAVPDPALARQRLSVPDWPLLRGPRRVLRQDVDPCCYAEILAVHGFGDDDMLAEAMRVWGRLLAHVQPQVLLADHAPLALLAARLHRVPVVHVATGWESPPSTDTLPVLRPAMIEGRPGFVPSLEAGMLARVNRLCAAHGAAPLGALGEVFRANVSLLATWPESDHFAPRPDRTWSSEGDGRRQPLYIGPLFSADVGAEPQWPPGRGPRVFVYLSAGLAADATLRALAEADVRVLAVVPQPAPAAQAFSPHPRCRLHSEPVKLRTALAEADLVVCHGGHGVVSASLLAGVPLVIVPTQLEQELHGQRMVERGAAEVVQAADVGTPLRELVERMLNEPRYKAAALAIARAHRGFDPDAVAQRVAATVDELMVQAA